MKKSLIAAAAAITLTLTASGTAQADGFEGTLACSTTGAKGSIYYNNWHGPDATINMSISLNDTAADGHHVRVRFLSKNTFGTTKYWAWRSITGGSGTGNAWYTTASDSGGLFDIGVQVARFEGDQMLNSCTDVTW
ncbi:hypothetical protein [Streptomyces sp. NPDC088400]|uniref:hypothetical protein n=1 Tax=Streptomyces sp. NPDC088400 TaxID=3365861 RepID=UPI00380B8A08